MILLLDNYDSFVHNLSRYLAELGVETRVVRNDATTVAEIRTLRPQAIVLSPGPGTPRESGICLDVVREMGADTPLLGVCLGHQAIVHVLGGEVVRGEPVHGRTSSIRHTGRGLFQGLPETLTATRYHSLIAKPETLPQELDVTAWTEDGVIMAVAHRTQPVYGVQFHPESVLTAGGHLLLRNFLHLAGIASRNCPEGDYRPPARGEDFYQRPIAEQA